MLVEYIHNDTLIIHSENCLHMAEGSIIQPFNIQLIFWPDGVFVGGGEVGAQNSSLILNAQSSFEAAIIPLSFFGP